MFGLGSRAYPNFCTFAHTCDNLMKDLGAEMIMPCGEGDELCGQEESFQVNSDSVEISPVVPNNGAECIPPGAVLPRLGFH